MIRLLVILMVALQVSFSLTSCTSPSFENGGDGTAMTDGPIDEGEISGDSGASSEPEATVQADNGAPEDEDLDAELDADNAGGEQAQAEAPKGDEVDALENDLSQEDTQEQPVAQEPPEEAPAPEVQAEAEPVPVPAPTPEPEAPEKAKIRDIRYMANSSGGTIVIESSKPVTYQTRMNQATRQLVIEIADAELPTSLQRPYVMNDPNSRIGSINAYQSAGSNTARVVVQMASGNGEPIVQQEGTAIVVIPPAAPLIAKAPPAAEPSEQAERPSKGSALSAHTLDEFLTGNQQFYGRPISLQVKDADVRDVVNFLAEESGANIVMSDDVDGKISLKLRRVPWDQALVTVMRSKNLGYVRQGNVLRISTLKSLQAETESANKIIESQKAIVPSVVEVIPISYATMDDLTKNLAPFLSKDGKVVADNRTNTLIVTDKTDVVERVRKLVKTLDVPPAQVSIESKIVEAVEDFETFIGVNFGFSGTNKNISPSGGAQGGPIDLTPSLAGSSLSKEFQAANPMNAALTVGQLDFFGDLTAMLTLAEKDQLAKVISAPRISAMNREKSTIKQEGENVSIIATKSDTTGAVTKQEKRTPFSLELSVTPQITADGGVIMDLDMKREFLGPVQDAEMQSQPVNKRSAKTKILVRNGQTAVIGGIYTSEENSATNGVPGLMDIPVIGWLFKNKSYTRAKNELLIFLTPRILVEEGRQASLTQ